MRSPIAIALSNPLNVTMLFVSVLSGLLAAWWLFPLGLIIWGIMVAMIANDRTIRVNYNMQARLDSLSARFQGLYAKVVRTQMRIFNTLLGIGGRTRRALEPVELELENLVNHIYTVCQQMNGPENYVKVSQANSDLAGERALLVLSMKGVTDPVILREKQEAMRSLDARIQKIKDISAMLDRVEAQISSASVVMDSLLADIMRLQVLGARETEKEVPQILQQVREQRAQFEAFESEAERIL